MKKETNKKVANAVKKLVIGAAVKTKMLEKKGAKMLKKSWKEMGCDKTRKSCYRK